MHGVYLVLFDIDGTLLDTLDMHLDVFRETYREIFNISVDRKLFGNAMGRSSFEFQKFVCNENGIAFSDEIFRKIKSRWIDKIYHYLSHHKVKILPGAEELIAFLKERDIPIGIVTGNSEKTGIAVLKAAGIDELFDVLAFSDGLHNRVDIVRRAIDLYERGGEKAAKVIVIGDTVKDIESAKSAGAFSVGVASGFSGIDELENAHPDILIETLKEYRKITDALGIY